jgi:hypothetical protein
MFQQRDKVHDVRWHGTPDLDAVHLGSMPRAGFLYAPSYSDGLTLSSDWLGSSAEVFHRSVSILLGGLPTSCSEETGLKAVTADHYLRPSGHGHRLVQRVLPDCCSGSARAQERGQPCSGTTEAAGATRPEFVARVTP